jgi:hypothetical protein
LSVEERVEEGLKEGLHGLNTVGGRLPTKNRVQANHRAEEGDCAKNERDVVRIGPVFNSARSRRVGGPEERRLGEGEGEPKGR